MRNIPALTATKINRRKLLRRATVMTFGTFVGVSVGRPPMAQAAGAPCTGPFGTGACNRSSCSGHTCKSSPGVTCFQVSGYCGSGACWTSGAGTCCDCECRIASPAHTGYCYCYG